MIQQLIRLNYRFLFNKLTISIVLVLNGITIFGFFAASSISEGYFYVDMYIADCYHFYLNESILLIKVVTVLLAIILTTTLNTASANNLNKYIVDRQIKKYNVFISKLITICLVMLLLMLLFFSQFIILAKLLTPYTLNIEVVLQLAWKQYLQIIFYISLTNFLLCIFPSILLSITPIILFWYMEINFDIAMINGHNLLKKLYEYIPNLILLNNNYGLVVDYSKYTILLIIIILGNCLYFVKKDII
ncbi:hypothetical protein ACAG96_01415 [Candidatus Izemoplasma sp. B36]|uniref:hypothetical protein n=1 Tax=Candidatus Izemoplasma sp. B36 TaxID=3242468 RepID=UPI0035570B99